MCYCPQLEPIIGLANYQGDFTIYENIYITFFLKVYLVNRYIIMDYRSI